MKRIYESREAWRAANKDKLLAMNRAWRNANRGRVRELEQKYGWKRRGLPEPTRPCPVACECCGNLPGSRAMSLDHDHTTGKFRGWLCGNCNTGIGKLGDSIVGLRRATAYLRRSSS